MNRPRWWLLLFVAAGVLWLASSLRAAAPSGHFVVAGNIVTDTVTGLVWQHVEDGTTRNYSAANTYCSTNAPALPGAGWRLPNVKELSTLFDPTAAAPMWDPAFSGSGGYYWTSDSRPQVCPSGGACQLILDFTAGGVASTDITNAASLQHTRCVR